MDLVSYYISYLFYNKFQYVSGHILPSQSKIFLLKFSLNKNNEHFYFLLIQNM